MYVSVVGIQLYRDCGHVAVMTSSIWTVGMQLYMDCGHVSVVGMQLYKDYGHVSRLGSCKRTVVMFLLRKKLQGLWSSL